MNDEGIHSYIWVIFSIFLNTMVQNYCFIELYATETCDIDPTWRKCTWLWSYIQTRRYRISQLNLLWNPPTIILSLVLWVFSTRKTLLHCYFCWWRGAHCWHSPPNPPTLPRSVCACVYVCFRKWCRASLCKFIHDTAETKISLLKSAHQPFGGLMPCLPCVLYM